MEYKNKHRFTSILIYGDYNARHIDWGDHKTERRGTLLKDFAQQTNLTLCSPFNRTFVCDNGGSVIDLLLAQGNICNKINTQWLEMETETERETIHLFYSCAPVVMQGLSRVKT